MLSEFDELVKQRKELQAWWSLRETVAKYDSKLHSLRVDFACPTMVAFCGQQYAGAKNYHDAPSFFRNAIRRAAESHAHDLAKEAYQAEMERLNAEIRKCREDVLNQLEQSGAE